MDNKDIQALLIKYREGKTTDREAWRIHRWYESLNSESRLSLDEDERLLLENKLLSNIWKEIGTPEEKVPAKLPTTKWWRSYIVYSGIAAALIVSIAGILLFKRSAESLFNEPAAVLIHTKSGSLITHENNTSVVKQIILEDKSVVSLSPGSKIIFPREVIHGKRMVQLIGEAFFEITKNPKKPFYVYSGRLITRVLGTSFKIKTNAGDQAVEVEVVTGKVSVFENTEVIKENDNGGKRSSGVILTPNQKVVYFAESGHLLTSLVEKPVPMERVKQSSKMIFNNVEILTIISQLQRDYGIEIVVENDRLDNCTFTGDLSDMSLFDKLDLICKSNAAMYEVKGTRILVSGKGCDS